MRTYAFIIISLLTLSSLRAAEPDTLRAPLLSSLSVGVDLVGAAQQIIGSKFSNMEAMAQIGFKGRYFPTVEIGVGHGRREGQENTNLFRATAPYFRLGCDYNFNKRGPVNRFLLGLRYAWTAYNYDFTSDDFRDPVWGGQQPLRLTSQSARAQWLEIAAGVQTRLFAFVHLGWTIRLKARLSQKRNPYGQPWYIPGYGRNGSTAWGGTVNILFDIETKWTKKKK